MLGTIKNATLVVGIVDFETGQVKLASEKGDILFSHIEANKSILNCQHEIDKDMRAEHENRV